MKLQWLLSEVRCCMEHGVELISLCPHCNRHQSGSATRERVTSCGHCKKPLYATVTHTYPGNWKTHAADLVDLVRTIASDPQLLFPSDGYRAVVTQILKRPRPSMDREMREIATSVHLSAVIHGGLISFYTARRLSLYLGIRLADLFSGTLQGTSDMLDTAWGVDCLPKIGRRRTKLTL